MLLLTNFNTNYVCSSIILMFTLGLPLGSFQHPQTHCCFVTYMPLACVFCFTKTIVPKYFLYDPPPQTHQEYIFFCFKNTHTSKQKAKETKEEKRKTNETKEEKKKENSVVVNSIYGKCNRI